MAATQRPDARHLDTDGDVGRGPPLARPAGWLSNLSYWLLWAVVGLVLRLWLRLRRVGEPPRTGPYVLVANHGSFLDPLVLGACVRRRIIFLMTATVFRSRALGWFYRWSLAIPLAVTGGNREALRAARSVLQQGRSLAIFPEGGLSRDGLPLLGSPGAVSLVFNEAVPIVPVGILGAAAAMPIGAMLPRARRVTVRFGEPITVAELAAVGGRDRRERLQAATRLIMERIAALSGNMSRESELDDLRRRG